MIAGVLAANLYRILGKKTETSDLNIEQEQTYNIEKPAFSEDVLDYSKKQILYLDKNFSFEDFLEGARSAFKLIVTSFKNNNLGKVKSYLSETVYKSFESAKIDESSSFDIKSLEAFIVRIDVAKKVANIKVKFISQQESYSNSKQSLEEVTDFWTFEKDVTSNNPIWILTEVNSE